VVAVAVAVAVAAVAVEPIQEPPRRLPRAQRHVLRGTDFTRLRTELPLVFLLQVVQEWFVQSSLRTTNPLVV
jgi:hypothetical protein